MTDEELSKLTPEEKAAYDLGFHNGQLATDDKLEESLMGLRKGNEKLGQLIGKLRQACEERDVFISLFTRVAWTDAARGLLATGFHPPQVHADPRQQPRVGKKPCTKCNAKIKPWDALTLDEKTAQMAITFKSVMRDRAERKLQAGVSAVDTPEKPSTAPTNKELGGKAEPAKWEPLDAEAMRPTRTALCETAAEAAACDYSHDCGCGHLVEHCCQKHCCCLTKKLTS